MRRETPDGGDAISPLLSDGDSPDLGGGPGVGRDPVGGKIWRGGGGRGPRALRIRGRCQDEEPAEDREKTGRGPYCRAHIGPEAALSNENRRRKCTDECSDVVALKLLLRSAKEDPHAPAPLGREGVGQQRAF